MVQVCSYFLAGYCAYGKSCRFAHLHPDGTPLPGEDIEVPSTREPNSQVSSSFPADEPGAMNQPSHAYSGTADAAWQDDEADWACYPEDAHQSYADQGYHYSEAWEYGTDADPGHDGAWQECEAGAGEAAHGNQQGAPKRRLPKPVDLGDAW